VGVNRYSYLLTRKAVTLTAVAESDIRLVDVYWTFMTNAVIFRIFFAATETRVFDMT